MESISENVSDEMFDECRPEDDGFFSILGRFSKSITGDNPIVYIINVPKAEPVSI